MTKLKRLENEILEIKRLINDIPKGIKFSAAIPLEIYNIKVEGERKPLQEKLAILETQRQFILDRRENLFWKFLWNVIIPIIVSIVTAYLSIKLGLVKLN